MIESAESSAGLLHKANDVEERSTDPEERIRTCEVVGSL